ncbi:hypothetical protein LXL04_025259 [Taraxacum kok-saghyz]
MKCRQQERFRLNHMLTFTYDHSVNIHILHDLLKRISSPQKGCMKSETMVSHWVSNAFSSPKVSAGMMPGSNRVQSSKAPLWETGRMYKKGIQTKPQPKREKAG